MKKLYALFSFLLAAAMIYAQTPQSFSYQAVARSANGEPVTNQAIAVKISILAGSASGAAVYSELQQPVTNSLGLFDLAIGNPAEVLTGTFASIDWGAGPYFLKLEVDETGGSDFQLMGISQLLSVPYALYSANTANNDDADADPANELQTISKDGQTVTLSQNGGSFTDEVNDADADPANELQLLSQNGLNVMLSQNGGTISVADNDNDSYNELQNITRNGLNVTLSQGGGTVNIADNDNDPANELQHLSNTKNGNQVNLGITNGSGTTIDVSDADADPANELQILSQNGLNVILSQNGGSINIADNDNDPANELQTVTENQYQVTLSQNGGTFMTGVKSYTQAEIDAMTPYNGLTLHNSTTNCINYYFINNWYEACGTCTPQPTQANAGIDAIIGDGILSLNLAANEPEMGNSLWSVVSGNGGIFEDATNPTTLFTGLPF